MNNLSICDQCSNKEICKFKDAQEATGNDRNTVSYPFSLKTKCKFYNSFPWQIELPNGSIVKRPDGSVVKFINGEWYSEAGYPLPYGGPQGP